MPSILSIFFFFSRNISRLIDCTCIHCAKSIDQRFSIFFSRQILIFFLTTDEYNMLIYKEMDEYSMEKIDLSLTLDDSSLQNFSESRKITFLE